MPAYPQAAISHATGTHLVFFVATIFSDSQLLYTICQFFLGFLVNLKKNSSGPHTH